MKRIVGVMQLLCSVFSFARAQKVTLSNNLLYDAWLTPNLRVGARLSEHWSVGLTAGYRPWPTSDATTRKWRHLLLSPEVRYWTDSVDVHHFFGANVIYSHFNVANVKFPFGMYKSVRDERRQGDLVALGLFYGYSWPLGRFWNLEALIGAALGYATYDRFPCTHCGQKIDDGKGIFALPEAAVNIVYNIPGRPRRVKEQPVEEPQPVVVPVVPDTVPAVVPLPAPFIPVLHAAPDFTGRAGQLQKDNPVLAHVSQYRPYDRTRILRKDQRALYVRFPLAKSELHTEFRDNAEVLSKIIDITRQIMADTTSSVKTIQIIGLASIEGSIAGNERLADARALVLQRYIQERLHLPDSLFDTVGGGEAWAEFRDQLNDEVAKESALTGQLHQALNMIDSEADLNVREQKLRRMNGGRTWKYLKEHHLGDQRNSGYIRIYYDYVPDTVAATINRATELLNTDCSDCHHEALRLLTSVRHDERAQNALGVALYLCGQQQAALDCFRQAAARGNATQMPDRSFYNGEVAYNLNGFYLKDRYDRRRVLDGFPVEINDAYVQQRYGDGDFIYADGEIPLVIDIRQWVDADKNIQYAPIWPYDYLFFGQMLTYGYVSGRNYEEQPSHLVKNATDSYRLYTYETNNRVYRAPAYYRNADMQAVHFNPNAVLAQKTNDGVHDVYPGMTAIDFTGRNDVSKGYKRGLQQGVFYPPLLDDAGLTRIRNIDETQNLLVYTPTSGDTYAVLSDYFQDPAYAEGEYRTVAINGQSVKGHLISHTSDGLVALTDHLLVDKQDFCCPISYRFADDKRMWYQRHLDRFVNLSKGWETVSLPFTAELVTTQTKGEITHFYSGSQSLDGDTKIGHEYWLREYKGKKAQQGDVFTAALAYPVAGGDDKLVENTFLWDYYKKDSDLDENADTYQSFYRTARTYENYPLLTQAKPYVIGFPGSIYYEFDLSGEWTVQHMAAPPAKVSRQVITMASEPGITVAASPSELTAQPLDGYTFMPNYMTNEVAGYVLNADGSRFDYADAATALPFRPYFIAGAPAQAAPAKRASHILIDGINSTFAFGDEDDPSGDDFGDGDLVFTHHHHTIRATSTLKDDADVHIYNVSGIAVANFTIQPGETIDTRINIAGVYIIRADAGRILKKIAIK